MLQSIIDHHFVRCFIWQMKRRKKIHKKNQHGSHRRILKSKQDIKISKEKEKQITSTHLKSQPVHGHPNALTDPFDFEYDHHCRTPCPSPGYRTLLIRIFAFYVFDVIVSLCGPYGFVPTNDSTWNASAMEQIPNSKYIWNLIEMQNFHCKSNIRGEKIEWQSAKLDACYTKENNNNNSHLYSMTWNALDCTGSPKSELCRHYLLFHILTSLDYPINYRLHLVSTLHTGRYLPNTREYVRVYFHLGFAVPALVFVRLHSTFHDVRRPTLDQVYNRFASMNDASNHLVLWFRSRCHYQIPNLQRNGHENKTILTT